MTGTIVNVGAIVAASLIGSRVKKGIKEEYQGAMFNAMGLAALMLGVHSAAGGMSDSRYPVLFIASPWAAWRARFLTWTAGFRG